MATATITETLELPGGASAATCKKIKVRLRLVVDADTEGIGRAGDSPASVGGVRSTSPDGSGTYTFTGVRPNSGSSDDVITSPTGTVYELVIVYPDRPAVTRYISVPDSAGPHQVGDILTVAPDPLPTGQDLLDLIDAAGLDLTDLPNGVTADAVIGLDGGALVELTPAQVMATHTGDTVDAHDASAISYAGGTGMSATDVEAAIDELATEKANLAGAAFTGDVTVTGAAGGQVHIDVDAVTDIAGVALFASGDTQPRAALTFSWFDVPALAMGPGGSTAVDTTLYRSAAGVLNANGGGFTGLGKGLTLTEQSAPSSPAANDITLYAADNGSGTTVLRTKDSAGTVTTLGSGGGGLTAEDVRDTIGTALVEGEAIDITVNDGADTISIAAEDATDANKGVVELATAAETTTGTDTGRAVTPDGLAGSEYGVEVVQILVTDPSGSALTTGDGKAYFMVPTKLNGWNLIRANAAVTTVSSSGTPTVQVHNVTDAVDMLSTRITIDANESTSYTAATPPVIDTTKDDVATGDLIRVDVDVAGTGAKGLIVVLSFQAP